MRPLSLCIYQVPEATHSMVWQHSFGCMEVCSRKSVSSGHRRTTKGNMTVGCPQGHCSNSWWSLEQGCPERPQWCHQPDITHQMTFTEHLWGAKAKLSTGFLQDTEYSFLPIIHLKTLGWNSFPPSGATHGGPGAWRLCQDGEMDKTRASSEHSPSREKPGRNPAAGRREASPQSTRGNHDAPSPALRDTPIPWEVSF